MAADAYNALTDARALLHRWEESARIFGLDAGPTLRAIRDSLDAAEDDNGLLFEVRDYLVVLQALMSYTDLAAKNLSAVINTQARLAAEARAPDEGSS